MIVQLNEIKEHLYIFDDSDDCYLLSLIVVAEGAVLKHLNRLSYDEFECIPEAIKHCIKLIVGNLYANRESISDAKVYNVPMTYNYLLQFYTKY